MLKPLNIWLAGTCIVFLVRKVEGKRLSVRPKHKRDDNIKIDLKETE
jgi:hypothetical protein